MNMRQFIQLNRAEIDIAINRAAKASGGRTDPAPRRNDRERAEWIRNDEGLHNWARSEGVKP
jgi:hypothetical protein